MNWAWASSLDQLWRSPAFPMWVTLAAAVFFALSVLVTLLRAERSVANGALAVITLLAIGISVATTARGVVGAGNGAADARAPQAVTAVSLPALSCLDGLAGDAVEAACEKALFASPESAAAAVSYTAGQVTRLAGFGDEASANKVMAPELSALRRAVERDRYGLVAHVLSVRDGCTLANCAFYRLLSDHNQIAANMTDLTYQGLIGRYALNWGNSNPAPNVSGGTSPSALPPSIPSGRPMSGDFPSSASIPPVSIMTPEAGAPKAAAAPSQPAVRAAATQTQSVVRAAAVAGTQTTAAVPARKPAAPRRAAAPAAAPAPLSPPAAPSDDN